MRLQHVVVVLMLGACGDGNDTLGDKSQISGWANSSSALGAYEAAREPVAFADGAFTYPDPLCPVTADDGTTATVTGNCTEASGKVWTGTATVVNGAGGSRTVDLADFGNDSFGGASKTNGTVTITEVAPDHHTFEIDLVTGGGITTSIEYSGSVVGTYTSATTTWNGSGRIVRDGDFYNGGKVDAVTVDQVRHRTQCPGEGFSGTTTMTSAGHVVVITYDGDTACDADHSARWSQDGDDQGTVGNITCSTGSGSGGVLVVLACWFAGRRRRRIAR